MSHTFHQFLEEMQILSSPWLRDPRASYQTPRAVIGIVKGKRFVKNKFLNEAWLTYIYRAGSEKVLSREEIILVAGSMNLDTF
jgi:hypothetical protein